MGTLVNETTATQKRAIREHLERFGYIDRDIAMELCDCDALRSRISDLRHDPVAPMNIETVWKTKKNRYFRLGAIHSVGSGSFFIIDCQWLFVF